MENYGRYEIIEKIATGGMAEIFLARSNAFNRGDGLFALKRIRRSYSTETHFVSRFIDEARICLELDHPNIVRVLDFGQLDGAYFMAMEFVDGFDVAVVMRALYDAQSVIPPPIAARIACEVAKGLHYAHTKEDGGGAPLNIVHRDISPQNILLSKEGDVKVADFGIAAARNKVALTTPGTVLGKLAYMSPEQATGGDVDCRADLWGLGVLLHEMLTCHPLFHGQGGAAAIARAMQETIPPPKARVADLPPALDAVVMQLLQHNKDARPASAKEAADAIAHACGDAIASSDDLAAYLSQLPLARPAAEPSDGTRELVASARTRVRSAPGSLESQLAAGRETLDDDAKEVLARFAADANLWRLVELGDRLARVHDAGASATYRTAAIVFAARGYLVQAVCALDGARGLMHPAERREEFLMLAHLARGDADPLENIIRSVGGERYLPILKDLHPEVFEHQDATRVCTPLFGHLTPKNFAKLAESARVHLVAPDTIVIQEGDPSHSLYAIGTGRFIATCTIDADPLEHLGRDAEAHLDNDAAGALLASATASIEDLPGSVTSKSEQRFESEQPRRASLAAFSDGDFFGEFSFLTERPRTATVEAIAPGIIIEVTHEMVDDVLAEEPGAVDPLLSFYKERVVEMTMAKSPIFGLLSVATRKELLRKSELVQLDDEEPIIEEGTRSDDFYFVKAGEVEIFHNEGEMPVFIDKLGQGQFFGEASALTRQPRSASVRAMGDVSLLRFERDALEQLLALEPQLKEKLLAVIASRQHERERLVQEHRALFGAS